MIKVLIFSMFILTTTFSGSSLAEDVVDLKELTTQCILAAKGYRPIKNDFPYKVIHTVEYEGWSGDAEHIELTHRVAMTIKYVGKHKDGAYWLKSNPKKKYEISVKSDASGNYELTENVQNGNINYIFHGIMKDGVIKGMWEKGRGQKAFSFYVKATK